ncbi:MAG: hypothetical protein K2P81_08770 [Bacteriovoracaceae bacterium]|nr:hypothetical protein [Bacteriovoracaceae bacterium]
MSQDFEIESEIFPSRTTSYDLGLLYFLDSSSVLKAGIKHVDYNEKTATASALPSAANTTNNGLPFSASPSQNFDVYTVDWSFIF